MMITPTNMVQNNSATDSGGIVGVGSNPCHDTCVLEQENINASHYPGPTRGKWCTIPRANMGQMVFHLEYLDLIFLFLTNSPDILIRIVLDTPYWWAV